MQPTSPGAQRRLLYGLMTVVLLMIAVGLGEVTLPRRHPWQDDPIPRKVRSADEVARRAVPGWARAEAAGLVFDLKIVQPLEGQSETSLILEKGWFSGRQMYILATVRAPEGEHVTPTWMFLNEQTSGRVDWGHFRQWGGFSPDGFHTVLIFDRFESPPPAGDLLLEVRQWAKVTPAEGLIQGSPPLISDTKLTLPWKPEYLHEPAPTTIPLGGEPRSWLGRTLYLDQLEVGTGQMVLQGRIRLPQGERDPFLGLFLQVGEARRGLKEHRVEPAGEPELYRVTAIYDGPDTWPAAVSADLQAIGFTTDQVLEWPIPWAKYRHVDFHAEGRQKRLMDPADQVTIPFYDSQLRLIYTWVEGAGIETLDPEGPPPYVQASLSIGGRSRDPESPGLEVAGPGGEVHHSFGGGGGVIWSEGRVPNQRNRHGITARWGRGGLPAFFETAEQLTLRYLKPAATLVIKERIPLWQP